GAPAGAGLGGQVADVQLVAEFRPVAEAESTAEVEGASANHLDVEEVAEVHRASDLARGSDAGDLQGGVVRDVDLGQAALEIDAEAEVEGDGLYGGLEVARGGTVGVGADVAAS